jgi:hypothetical protein
MEDEGQGLMCCLVWSIGLWKRAVCDAAGHHDHSLDRLSLFPKEEFFCHHDAIVVLALWIIRGPLHRVRLRYVVRCNLVARALCIYVDCNWELCLDEAKLY